MYSCVKHTENIHNHKVIIETKKGTGHEIILTPARNAISQRKNMWQKRCARKE